MTDIRRGANGRAADPDVEAELDRLPKTPIADLRSRYRELFRAEPPKAFGPDLLRRSIAHRAQERAYGGLSRDHQRLLDRLVKAAQAKPNGRLELPRRIKPGSELVRIWNQRTYRVVVMPGRDEPIPASPKSPSRSPEPSGMARASSVCDPPQAG
jgi:hypothetical protein